MKKWWKLIHLSFKNKVFYHFSYSNIRKRGGLMKPETRYRKVDRLKGYIEKINKKDRAKQANIDITPFVIPLQIEEEQPKQDTK